jgi:hypothetical protein
MTRFNSVPVIVQQMVDAMQDKTNSQNSRDNYMRTVETIKDYCEAALRDYAKKNKVKL